MMKNKKEACDNVEDKTNKWAEKNSILSHYRESAVKCHKDTECWKKLKENKLLMRLQEEIKTRDNSGDEYDSDLIKNLENYIYKEGTKEKSDGINDAYFNYVKEFINVF